MQEQPGGVPAAAAAGGGAGGGGAPSAPSAPAPAADGRVVATSPAPGVAGGLPLVHVHLPAVDSTNAFARAAARAGELDARALTAVTASAQTAGRGRGGRSWLSSAAGGDVTCTFAFCVPPAAVPRAYLLSPLLALVAARTLQAALDGAGAGGAAAPGGGAPAAAAGPPPPRVSVGIKWPNDLVAGGARKVGGILCELELLPSGAAWAALGVGVNVNSSPAGLLAGLARPAWPASSLSAEAGRALDVAGVTRELIAAFGRELPAWLAAGGDFGAWLPAYAAASVVLGRRVRFADGPRAVMGLAVGVAPSGGLLVAEEEWDGSAAGGRAGAPPREFIAGEVTGLTLVDGSEVVGGEGEPA